MPTYQYACTACGHQLEAVQSFSDEPLTECPACEGRLRKLYSAVGIVFKGSGFYRTDSRSGAANGAPKEAAKESAGSEGKDSGGKDSGSKESGGKDSGSKDSGTKESTPAKDTSTKTPATAGGSTSAKPAASSAKTT